MFLILMLLFSSGIVGADERKENIDIIIALDKSLSMVEEIGAVKDYVKNYIVDQLVIPGDYLLIIGFYGKTDILVSQVVQDETEKGEIKETIDTIQADGRFTDIGNALDVVRKELKKISNDKRRKYVLLLTDGKQEAPPTSKYYSPDGKFNHEFLENAKIIQKEGWKIEILGIGKIPQAEELAKKLSGNYTELSNQPSEREITEKTKNILSIIQAELVEKRISINMQGSGRISIRLIPKNLENESTVVVQRVGLSFGKNDIENAIEKTVKVNIQPGKKEQLTIPVVLKTPLKEGDYSGTLIFEFSGNQRFTPAAYDVTVHVKGMVESYLFLIIPFGIIILALIVFLVVMLARKSGKGRLKFRLIIEETPLRRNKNQWTISQGKNLYLNESHDLISITDHRTPKSIAAFSLVGESLRMNILIDTRFPGISDIPENVLNWNFKVRSESGKDFHLRLENVK